MPVLPAGGPERGGGPSGHGPLPNGSDPTGIGIGTGAIGTGAIGIGATGIGAIIIPPPISRTGVFDALLQRGGAGGIGKRYVALSVSFVSNVKSL